MTTPERPPGSHRRTPRSSRLAVLIASLIGIAVVAVVVTITLNNRGEPARSNSPEATRATLNKQSPSPSRATPATSPPTSATSSQGSSAPNSTAPTSGSTSAPAPTTGASTSTAAAALIPLDVLNDSRVTGLAARASDTFRAGGWDVASTGNFRGTDVPETTIFYPDGDKAAADRLASQFGIQRLEPASSDLSQSHLTVALARDWAQRG
jgi:LytR cell envelope-related transcriptional attenuator